MKKVLKAPVITMISAVTIVTVVFFAIFNSWWIPGVFWDLDVYTRAAIDNLNGRNAYRAYDGLVYVYHPLFLSIFSAIEIFVSLKYFLITIYLASIYFLLIEINRFMIFQYGKYYSIINNIIMPTLVAMTVMAVGITTLASGNLTGYLHFLLIGLFLRNTRLNKNYCNTWIMIFIGVFAALKPYFLAYILMALLDNFHTKRKIKLMSAAIAVFVTIWLSGFILYPETMPAFIENIISLQSGQNVDVGVGFYRIAYEIGFSKVSGIAAHILLSGLVLVWIWSRIQNAKIPKNSDGYIIALAYFGLTLINPRMKEYDLGPALIFLFIFWNAYDKSARHLISVLSIIFLMPALLLIVTFMLRLPPGFAPAGG